MTFKDLQRLVQSGSESDNIIPEFQRKLNLHRSTISVDVQYINEQCKEELRSFMEDKLPREIKQTYDDIIKDAEHIIGTTEDEKTRIQANHIRRGTVDSRIELATNADIAAKVMDMAASARQKNPMPAEEEEQQRTEDEEIEEMEGEEETTNRIF